MTSVSRVGVGDGVWPIDAFRELPASIQALRPVSIEIESRPSRVSRIDVLDYRPGHQNYSGLLAKPGTVTLFVARHGAEIIDRIREAVASDGGDDRHSGHAGLDRQIAAELTAQFRARTMVSIEEAVSTLLVQPAFASVRYGERTMAQSLFAPDGVEACVIAMPYNGGYVADDSFKLVEHYLPGSDERLTAVAVRHAPPLTPAERAALRAVPPDQREWSIGQPMACYAITAITVTLVLAGATYACPGIVEPEELPDETIKELGPAATARKLLALRRQVLEGS